MHCYTWLGFVRHSFLDVWYGLMWFDMVWYGLVWFGMVWYGMVWYGMVWSGLKQHPSKITMKVSSKSNFFWLF